jgi:hypothetical protein
MKKTIVTYLTKANGSVGRRLMIVLFAAGLSLGASAQRGVHYSGGGAVVAHGGVYHSGGVVYAYPHTYFGVGLGLGYGPWGYGYPFYGPWGWGYYPYPPFYYGYGAMPSPLAAQINNIKTDYSAQIKDVRHDKSLTHSDRKDKIRQLKKDRDAAVIQARHDYFDQHYRRNNSNGPQPYNGDGSQSQQQKEQKPMNGNDGPEYQNSQSSPGGSTTQE